MIVSDMRLLRFGIIGLSGLCIDFFTTWICKEKIQLNKYLSSSIGFFVAVINNFFINRYWTFGKISSPVADQFLKFLMVSAVGLLINNILLYLLVKNIKLNFYVLKAAVIALVFFWNYFINLCITFN